MSQDEIRASLKTGNWLTGLAAPGTGSMIQSSMTAYNIAGQVLPAKRKTNFTACFLVPKKTHSQYELAITENLRVKLTK